MATDLEPDYDATSSSNAWKISNEVDKILMGMIYHVENSTYSQRFQNVKNRATKHKNEDFESLLKRYSV